MGLKIVMVSAEVETLARTGGLGDAVAVFGAAAQQIEISLHVAPAWAAGKRLEEV